MIQNACVNRNNLLSFQQYELKRQIFSVSQICVQQVSLFHHHHHHHHHYQSYLNAICHHIIGRSRSGVKNYTKNTSTTLTRRR